MSNMGNKENVAYWQRLDVDDKGFIIHACKCSNCGWYSLALSKAFVKQNFLFCPNCGKKIISRKEYLDDTNPRQ